MSATAGRVDETIVEVRAPSSMERECMGCLSTVGVRTIRVGHRIANQTSGQIITVCVNCTRDLKAALRSYPK